MGLEFYNLYFSCSWKNMEFEYMGLMLTNGGDSSLTLCGTSKLVGWEQVKKEKANLLRF